MRQTLEEVPPQGALEMKLQYSQSVEGANGNEHGRQWHNDSLLLETKSKQECTCLQHGKQKAMPSLASQLSKPSKHATTLPQQRQAHGPTLSMPSAHHPLTTLSRTNTCPAVAAQNPKISPPTGKKKRSSGIRTRTGVFPIPIRSPARVSKYPQRGVPKESLVPKCREGMC